MSIALRFIPILLEETDKIMKAQIARGADLDSGNMIQKAKAMIPILAPLFVSAFRRANDLAIGHGIQMLPWRGRKNQDEAPGIQRQRPGGIYSYVSHFCIWCWYLLWGAMCRSTYGYFNK